MSARLVVLVSGNGSNLQAILDACDGRRLDATVVGVIANSPSAYGLERARKSGVATEVLVRIPGENREAYDDRLAVLTSTFNPTLVVLAGWLRVLTPRFVDQFGVINLHPALPGEFAGLHAIERAFAQWEKGELSRSGVMVHWVPDARVDEGPVILAQEVEFLAGDTLEAFSSRMHETEHDLLVRSIQAVLEEQSI